MARRQDDGRPRSAEPTERPVDDVEYVGLMAEGWDALRGDTSAWTDRAWLREIVRRYGEPVLDVGCGTGRILLDFLAEGIDVDGVDNSPDMLGRLMTKAVAAGIDVEGRIHRQRMESLDLPRRYRAILVPSSSFQLVIDPVDAAEAMRRFYALLLPGGALAMPFLVMDAAYEELWTREAPLGDGRTIRRTFAARFDPAVGIEATDDLHEVFRDGLLIASEHSVRPRATRAYTRERADELFGTAGFVDLEHAIDFTPDDGVPDRVFTIVGHRPA